MYFQDYDELREKIISNLREYTEAYKLDTSELSYVSQFINAIAVADDNVLFYISLLLNEGSIYDAILPETIIRTAKEFGVPTNNIIPGECYGRISIAIPDSTMDGKYIVNSEMAFSPVRSDAPYVPLYLHEVKYDAVSKKAYVVKEINGNRYPVYSNIDVGESGNFISFDINMIQQSQSESTFITDEDLKEYTIDAPSKGSYSIIEIEVDGYKYKQVENIYVLEPKTFTVDFFDKTTLLTFGTSLDSLKITKNSTVKIITYISLGASGNVVSNSLEASGQILEHNRGVLTNISIEHPDVVNGTDPMDLLKIKKIIHSKFLTKNSIISRRYDVDNIKSYLDNIALYVKGVMVPSLTSEFLVFNELTLNNELLETNTIKVEGTDNNTIKQNIVYDMISKDDVVQYERSSAYNDKDNLVDNFAAVCPFEMKFNDNFKEFRYYSLKSGLVAKMNVLYGIISPYDYLTAVRFESFQGKYDNSNNIMTFSLTMNAISPDLSKLYDSTAFTVKARLVNQDTSEEIYEATNGPMSSTNSGKINYDDVGNYTFNFYVTKDALIPDVNYVIETSVYFMGDLISSNASDVVVFYEKLPISSKVTEGDPLRIYKTNETFDNVHESYFTQRIKTMIKFDSNGAGTVTTISGNKLPEVGTEMGPTDYSVFTSGSLDITDLTDPANPTVTTYVNTSIKNTSKTNFIITFSHPALSESGVYALKLTLYYNNTSIDFAYTNIIFGEIEKSKYRTVYQVPVLSKKSYNKLLERNSEILPFTMINKMYNKLEDKVLFGMKYNIKFLKTFGYINGMKYNQTYSKNPPLDKSVDPLGVDITMPIPITASIMPSPTFNADIHAVMIKNAIIDYVNNNTGVESNLYISKIAGAVFEAVGEAIYSFEIDNVDDNIIYDFTTDDISKVISEYVPELVTVNPDQIKLIIK